MGCHERSCFCSRIISFYFPCNFFVYTEYPLQKKLQKSCSNCIILRICDDIAQFYAISFFAADFCNFSYYFRFLVIARAFTPAAIPYMELVNSLSSISSRSLSLRASYASVAIPYMELVNSLYIFPNCHYFPFILIFPPLFAHHTSSTYRLRVLTPLHTTKSTL